MILFKRLLILLILTHSSILADKNKYDDLVEAIERLCNAPSSEKSTFIISEVDGEASIDVDMILEGRGRVEGSFEQKEWDGVQRVLRKEQLKENENYRKCSQKLTIQFLKADAKEKRLQEEKDKADAKEKRLQEEKDKADAKKKRLQEAKDKADAKKKRLQEAKDKADAKKKRLKEAKNKADAKKKRLKEAKDKADAKKKRAYVKSKYRYLFYGIGQNNNWKKRYFKVLYRESNSIPKVGDSIQALSPVTKRSFYIEKINDKWTNAEGKGSTSKGDIFTVKEVKEVFPNYFWIKY